MLHPLYIDVYIAHAPCRHRTISLEIQAHHFNSDQSFRSHIVQACANSKKTLAKRPSTQLYTKTNLILMKSFFGYITNTNLSSHLVLEVTKRICDTYNLIYAHDIKSTKNVI